jgi:hypothetical protein
LIVNVGILNDGKSNEQVVVTVSQEDSLGVYEVVKLVAKDRMYSAGLEKSYIKLVVLGTVGMTIADTITLHHKAGILEEVTWNRLISCFEHYIDRSRSWDEIETYLLGGSSL